MLADYRRTKDQLKRRGEYAPGETIPLALHGQEFFRFLFTQLRRKGITNDTVFDTYNIGLPLPSGHIPVEVAARDSELSAVLFMEERGGVWRPDTALPIFDNYQDPFWATVNGEILFGAVEIAVDDRDQITNYRTVFHYGDPKGYTQSAKFAIGPWGEKDIRTVSCSQPAGGPLGTELIVFRRPQGAIGGRGSIGYQKCADLGHFKHLLEDIDLTSHDVVVRNFRRRKDGNNEWGGVNQAMLLKSGEVGIIGHIAYFDEQGGKHYHVTVSVVDPLTGELTYDPTTRSYMRIIAERADFPKGTIGNKFDLNDVTFAAGIVRHGDGQATLYTGIGDSAPGKREIPDPFGDR